MAQREVYREIIEQQHNEMINPVPPLQMGIVELQTRLEMLESAYKEFMSAHMKIIAMRGQNRQVQAAVLVGAQTHFMATKICIGERLQLLRQANEQPIINNVLQPPPVAPPLLHNDHPEVGTFSGDFGDWPIFHDIFVEEVHNNERLSAVRKLRELQKACKGTAEEVLGPWKPIAANYVPAWEHLCATYNDQHRTKESYINQIMKLPVLTQETHDGLRHIINTVEGVLRQLGVMNVQTESWDVMVMFLIKERLPGVTIQEWESHRQTLGGAPTLRQMLIFLTLRARGRADREQAGPSREARGSTSSHHTPIHHTDQARAGKSRYDTRKSESSSNNGYQQRKPFACHDCGDGSHVIYKCPKFLARKIDDRVQRIRHLKLCMICLKPGHISKNCTNKRSLCRDCPMGQHSYLTCYKTQTKRQAATNVSKVKRAAKNEDQ